MAFQIDLGFAVAALMAAAAFLPRRYPVLEDLPMRRLLTATAEDTKFALLDAQIEMVVETATLVKRKGRRVTVATACLAIPAAPVVAGTHRHRRCDPCRINPRQSRRRSDRIHPRRPPTRLTGA